MNADQLVDFMCVRETHQEQPGAGIVSMLSGALMLCPRGETLGHVWRAAAGAPFIEDRSVARAIASRGHAVRLRLRPN